MVFSSDFCSSALSAREKKGASFLWEGNLWVSFIPDFVNSVGYTMFLSLNCYGEILPIFWCQ